MNASWPTRWLGVAAPMASLVTVVELPSFERSVRGELSEQEVDEIKDFVAENPTAGVLVKGTGGVRKLRWAASGRGKRGGGRVIYYFHDLEMPLYLFKFYTKAAKSDLTASEKKELSGVVEALVKQHKPGTSSGG